MRCHALILLAVCSNLIEAGPVRLILQRAPLKVLPRYANTTDLPSDTTTVDALPSTTSAEPIPISSDAALDSSVPSRVTTSGDQPQAIQNEQGQEPPRGIEISAEGTTQGQEKDAASTQSGQTQSVAVSSTSAPVTDIPIRAPSETTPTGAPLSSTESPTMSATAQQGSDSVGPESSIITPGLPSPSNNILSPDSQGSDGTSSNIGVSGEGTSTSVESSVPQGTPASGSAAVGSVDDNAGPAMDAFQSARSSLATPSASVVSAPTQRLPPTTQEAAASTSAETTQSSLAPSISAVPAVAGDIQPPSSEPGTDVPSGAKVSSLAQDASPSQTAVDSAADSAASYASAATPSPQALGTLVSSGNTNVDGQNPQSEQVNDAGVPRCTGGVQGGCYVSQNPNQAIQSDAPSSHAIASTRSPSSLVGPSLPTAAPETADDLPADSELSVAAPSTAILSIQPTSSQPTMSSASDAVGISESTSDSQPISLSSAPSAVEVPEPSAVEVEPIQPSQTSSSSPVLTSDSEPISLSSEPSAVEAQEPSAVETDLVQPSPTSSSSPESTSDSEPISLSSEPSAVEVQEPSAVETDTVQPSQTSSSSPESSTSGNGSRQDEQGLQGLMGSNSVFGGLPQAQSSPPAASPSVAPAAGPAGDARLPQQQGLNGPTKSSTDDDVVDDSGIQLSFPGAGKHKGAHEADQENAVASQDSAQPASQISPPQASDTSAADAVLPSSTQTIVPNPPEVTGAPQAQSSDAVKGYITVTVTETVTVHDAN